VKTQPQKVLAYLKRHRTITPREALMDLGIYRLAAVVFDLRYCGWDITTESKTNPDTGSKYASYRLMAA
jgi:hypothetical protein